MEMSQLLIDQLFFFFIVLLQYSLLGLSGLSVVLVCLQKPFFSVSQGWKLSILFIFIFIFCIVSLR